MATQTNNEMLSSLKRLRLEMAYLRGRIKSEINQLQANGEIVHSSISALEHLRDYMVEILEYFSGTESAEIFKQLDDLHANATSDKYVRFWFAVGEEMPDGSTQTIETFDTLPDAKRFAESLGSPCFIDKWKSTSMTPGEGCDEIDETFSAIEFS